MKRDRSLVIQGLVAGLLVTPALAMGAVHPSVLAVYILSGAAALAYLAFHRTWADQVRLDLPGVVFIVLILVTLLQIIPLPAFLVGLISPAAHEVRSRACIPLGIEPPGFMPLSLDVVFTAIELGKLVLYLSVYWICLAWIRRRGSRAVTTLIVSAGAVVAAVFLAHKVLFLDRIYGFYTPAHRSFDSEWSAAPLVNPNHLAALLCLCSIVAVGRALAATSRPSRMLLIGLAGLLGGSLLLTLSRGGIAAFVAGQGIFVALMAVHRFARTRKPGSVRGLAWLPLGLALSLGLGLLAAQDEIAGEFGRGDLSKLEFMKEGLGLVALFPAAGVGRGAFWVGFPMVSDLAAKTTFTHAENAVVQLLADYGVLFGSLALIGMGAVVAVHLRKIPSKADHIAAVAALVAFGLHNLVDFNMEIPGVAVLCVALLGVVQAPANAAPLWGARPVRRYALVALALGGVIMAGAVGLYCARHTVEEEGKRHKLAFEAQDAALFSRENLASTVTRHPADWYLPFLIGVRQYHLKGANPLPWLARALELNPASASAHFYVGRTLLRADRPGQAMIEFRLAARGNTALAPLISELLVLAYPSFEALSQIAVTREDKQLLWGALANAFASRGLSAQAEAADAALLSENILNPRSLARQARRLAGRNELERAMELADELGRIPGHGPSGAMVRAELLERQGQRARAALVLEQALARSPDHQGLLHSLAWTRQRAGDLAGSRKAVADVKALAKDVKARARAVLLEADLEAAQNRVQTALAKYRQAYQMDSSSTKPLERIAELAEKTGDWARLEEALRRLKAADPGNAEWKERLDELESRRKGRNPI